MKLRVLLEAAPQAAKIASLSLDNDLSSHLIFQRYNPPAIREASRDGSRSLRGDC